jgi:hypothetical protein
MSLSPPFLPGKTTANVKLVGHANARQKIQLHRKLKEELTDMQRRCKVRKGDARTCHSHMCA